MKKQKEVLISVNDNDLKLLNEKTYFINFKKKLFWKHIVKIGERAFCDCTNLDSIKLPASIKEIGKKAFSKSNLKKIELNRGLSIINNGAFSECENLKEIEIPASVRSIGDNCFFNSGIEKIKLNKGLTVLGKGAFSECKNLKEIEVPGSVRVINDNCFFNSGIEKVKLNKNTDLIGSYAFSKCKNLREIELPASIITIGDNAFNGSAIEKVIFNNIDGLLTNIEKNAFCNCKNLKEIDIPSSVEIIENRAFCNSGIEVIRLNEGIKKIECAAFSDCKNLEEIVLPDSINSLKERAFYSSGLKKIKLSDKISVIESLCFAHCKNLKEIEIPSVTHTIARGAFMNSGLESIKFNDRVYEIDNETFNKCENLENVVLPKFLNIIGTKAFANSGLKSIIFNNNIKVIGESAFENCKNLKYVEIPSSVQVIGDNAFKNCDFKYLYKLENGNWILSNSEIVRDDIIDEYDFSNLNDFYTSVITRSDYKKIFSKLNAFKKDNIIITNEIINNNFLFDALFLKDNNDFFKRLFQKMNFNSGENEEIFSFVKLLYSLGAFEDDKVTRQKACNFIENEIDKGCLNKDKINKIFKDAIIIKYEEDWAEFILDKKNFHALLNNDNEQFISDIYNAFQEIKEFNRSNRGNQRYLKVTPETCERFFKFGKFNDVDEDSEDIAIVLKAHTRNQDSFDDAKRIRKKYLELREQNKIRDNILKESLVEKDIFESIENIKKDIINDTKETLNMLDELANKKFTYEFLSKYDPRNFVLGKYCSCCSHIEGAGYGVMRASILNPDCQNLVIKDKSGKIIAKSTLYINRKQGYGVFNNIEVSESITSKEEKEMIYKKYKQAIADFANEYNKENQIKLTQINVGMGRNDLSDIIEIYDEEGKVLKGINFSYYSCRHELSLIYEGDWFIKQYVMWKKGK